MGYTHYFKQTKPVSTEQWNAFEKDAKVVIDHVQNKLGIVLISNDSSGVLIDNERVNLNGDESRNLDHETFYLAKDYRDFNFCKTARKPYDIAVCSLLLLAHEHMNGHHEIGSDGSFDEWQEAMELNAKLFGYGYKLPTEIDPSDNVQEFEDELAHKYPKKTVVSTPVVKNSRYNL